MLRGGPITQSLEELAMHFLKLPPAEVSHLSALRRLRTLRLDWCFSPILDVTTLATLSPPAPLLPALTSLFIREDHDLERKLQGPSFDWMQQRRTQ